MKSERQDTVISESHILSLSPVRKCIAAAIKIVLVVCMYYVSAYRRPSLEGQPTSPKRESSLGTRHIGIPPTAL